MIRKFAVGSTRIYDGLSGIVPGGPSITLRLLKTGLLDCLAVIVAIRLLLSKHVVSQSIWGHQQCVFVRLPPFASPCQVVFRADTTHKVLLPGTNFADFEGSLVLQGVSASISSTEAKDAKGSYCPSLLKVAYLTEQQFDLNLNSTIGNWFERICCRGTNATA